MFLQFVSMIPIDYVRNMKTNLNDWEHVRGQSSGKLKIALAGNFFEPLYGPVFKNLGFTDEEIQRLQEFYEFYDPAEYSPEEPIIQNG